MLRGGACATAAGMLLGFSLLLAPSQAGAQAEPKPPEKAPAPGPSAQRRPTPAEVAKADLAKVQGTWEHEVRDPQGKRLGRVVKHIQGNKEMVVHERADGQVTHAHRVDIEVGRFGLGAENIAWSLMFIMLPLACVYYPLETLPQWLQYISLALAPTHVFEGMRPILKGQPLDNRYLLCAFGLNALSMLWFTPRFDRGTDTTLYFRDDRGI